MDQDLRDKHWQQGFEEWKLYSNHYQKSFDTFDKTLITVAAGAFIVSISLVHEFGTEPCEPWLLYSGWICFASALITMLVAMRIGLSSYREQALISGKYFEDPRIDIERERNKYIPVINRLYMVVMALIGLGIVLFISFAILNYPMKPTTPSSTGNTKTTQWSGTKSAPLTVTVPKGTTSGGTPSTPSGNTGSGGSNSGSNVGNSGTQGQK